MAPARMLTNIVPAALLNRGTRLDLLLLDRRDVPSVSQAADGTWIPDAVAVDGQAAITSQAPPVHPKRFAVGSGPGQRGQVSVYDAPTNALLTTVTPFGEAFTGGVRVATADVTGDGIDDLVAVAGAGTALVKVFDGATGKVVADFTAFTAGSGAFVATGDVTGDGRADVVLGAGVGTKGEIKIYDGKTIATGRAVQTLAVFGGSYTAGVRVAVGDITGDGKVDVVAAPGLGASPVLTIFTNRGPDKVGMKFTTTTMAVGGAKDTGGVFVSTGDYNGDGVADLAVGRVVNSQAVVTVFQGGSLTRKLVSAYGFTAVPDGGVPVSLKDLNGDGKAELIAAGGTGTSQVRVISPAGGLFRSFMAFPPTYRGGVFVG